MRTRHLIDPDANTPTTESVSKRTKLLRKSQSAELHPAKRNFKTPQASEPAAPKHYVSRPARQRHPVEYQGHLITNEQQPDGNWIASFVRMGGAADCAQLSAPYPASYLAISDAKRKIDAVSSKPTGNRKHERVAVALAGAIFTTETTQECQVLDLSQGGARLRLDKPIAPEEELHLHIKGFGRFRARVVRSGENEMAVRFILGNDAVFGLLNGLSNYVKGLDIAQTNEREEIRVITSIAAVCQMDGVAIPCEIINASMRSMSLRILERPPIGSLVTLGGAKVRVVRHHDKGIAVQCVSSASQKSDRFNFTED